MKFLIEFSGNNLIKFRSFIRMCYKVFTKSGIIMTIIKNLNIRVAPDPFNISNKFHHELCATESLNLYKYSIFIEYPLIPANDNSQKNSTFNKLELKTTKNENNSNAINSDQENRVLSFRISNDELKKLNELLQTNFISADQITLKADKISEFLKIKLEAQNYTNACLTIFDKQTNSTKSVILFKPMRKPYLIIDYEDDDEMEDGENKLLGKFIYSNIIRTRIIKKFGTLVQKNFNKIINLYLYKVNDTKEKNIKSYLLFSYLSNCIYLGKYIQNEENNINPEEYKNIYKIQINSDLLIRILRNFNNDMNNPDYISVWSKGVVFKTYYRLRYNFDDNENNQGENNEQNFENEDENNEDDRSYMIIKAFNIFEKNTEVLTFEGINIDDGYEKKKYILNLIENNVDDKHEELNKSLELSDIEGGDIFRGNNSFMDEEEDENINEDEEEDIGEIIKKKKKKKMKKKLSENNDDENLDNISEDNNNEKSKEKKSNNVNKNKKKKAKKNK